MRISDWSSDVCSSDLTRRLSRGSRETAPCGAIDYHIKEEERPMNEQIAKTIKPAPVRKSIVVNTTPERAFDVFVSGMSRWWVKQFSINKGSPIKDVVVEPHAGGRWFERGEDGSECQWGKVLTIEPPTRLVLAWQITPDWRFDPDLVTELDIRFVAEGAGTRVSLEHTLDGYGEAAAEMFKLFDAPHAWAALLESFARAVD